MKYSKLILLVSALIISVGLFLTACDNRVVDPLDYDIAYMRSDTNVIHSDGDEATFATIQVMVKDRDNFAVFGQAVQFRSDIGYLTPAETVTDSSGIATCRFHDGNAFGSATIDAIVGSVSESIEIDITGVPPQDVSSIGFDVSEQIEISVQGTGGTESFELVASLYDNSGQLITEAKTVVFELLYAPEGTNINYVGCSLDSTESIGGKASVNINSGEHSGIVTCKVSTTTLAGANISSTKSNIVVASGFTHTVQFSIGGHSTGTDMGSGMWKVQISALLNDIEGNPVASGTHVFFSLPEEPEWASVVASAYVNNMNATGDSLAGVAYSYLNYHGTHTNDVINVLIETGVGDIFEGELVLPIQNPSIDIVAVPLHLDWQQTPPDQTYKSIETRITVKDGQNNPIDNQMIVFSTSLGEPLEPYPPDTNDPYTGLTGIVGGENGRLNKEVEFFWQECPAPGTAPPGTTTGTITAQILGTGVSNQITVILRRYIN